jgi:hypothetical protein
MHLGRCILCSASRHEEPHPRRYVHGDRRPGVQIIEAKEAELVGATDYMSSTIWSKFFLEAQGHKITSNIFEQDNMSAIRLEKNGRTSAGKQSRHIDIHFFFMKDQVQLEGINVRHCPTEDMLADFLTKSITG